MFTLCTELMIVYVFFHLFCVQIRCRLLHSAQNLFFFVLMCFRKSIPSIIFDIGCFPSEYSVFFIILLSPV